MGGITMSGTAKVGTAGQRRAVFAVDEDAELAAAARLERFRATHADVPVLLLGACPKAWAVGQKIVRPDARTSRTGTPQ
jgi:hypothetical protein